MYLWIETALPVHSMHFAFDDCLLVTMSASCVLVANNIWSYYPKWVWSFMHLTYHTILREYFTYSINMLHYPVWLSLRYTSHYLVLQFERKLMIYFSIRYQSNICESKKYREILRCSSVMNGKSISVSPKLQNHDFLKLKQAIKKRFPVPTPTNALLRAWKSLGLTQILPTGE